MLREKTLEALTQKKKKKKRPRRNWEGSKRKTNFFEEQCYDSFLFLNKDDFQSVRRNQAMN